jgi:hypothetical protein
MLFYEGQYISPLFIMDRFNCEKSGAPYCDSRLGDCSYIGMKRKMLHVSRLILRSPANILRCVKQNSSKCRYRNDAVKSVLICR